VGDILSPEFMARYKHLKEKHINLLRQYDYKYDVTEYEKEWFEGIHKLREVEFIDSEYVINEYINEEVGVLAEGAQGAMLDIDFGTYPYVTSSNTLCAGACTGLGVAPNRIGDVYGIFKAYCSRVGSGPFPTELFDETGDRLRDIGKEYGSTTGRPRRCGWLDLVALKYSVMLNGVTALIMMKADVMNDFDTIKVAVDYDSADGETSQFPYELSDDVKPLYREFEGWKCDINKVRKYEDFPPQFKQYVEFIEAECGVPIKILSVGPDREETIIR
jgi:adenylosuccinate synthase